MATGSIKKPVRAVCKSGTQVKLLDETSSATGDETYTVTPTSDGMLTVFVYPISGIANEPIVYLMQNGTLFTQVSGSKNALVPFALSYPVAKGETYTVQTRRCNIKPGIFLVPYI